MTEGADKLGIVLEGVQVDVEGDLDLRGFFGFAEGVRPGYKDVRVTVTLTGPESDETYARLTEEVDAHCPVLDMFSAPVPVTTQVLTATKV
jgi:putative redox protein